MSHIDRTVLNLLKSEQSSSIFFFHQKQAFDANHISNISSWLLLFQATDFFPVHLGWALHQSRTDTIIIDAQQGSNARQLNIYDVNLEVPINC